MATENKIYTLAEAVKVKADAESSQIKTAIDASVDKAYAAYSAKARKEYEYRLQKEITKNASLITAKSNSAISERKSRLYRLRAEITDKVFAEVKEKLSAFCESSDYEKYLLAEFGTFCNSFGAFPEIIYLRKADEKFAALFGNAAQKCKIEYSADIEIGGFVACADGITADCTLDRKLAESRETFVRTSGLEVV